MKKVVLIKIGGSLITDKNKPFALKKKNLELICQEIKLVLKKAKRLLVVGHGGGSFPHVPAKKYKTHLGIVNKRGQEGFAKVQEAAARLNQIVVQNLIKAGVNAVSVSPSSCYLTKGGRIKSAYLDPVRKMLELGLLPVLYGDVVADEEKGSFILSTEKALGYLGLFLQKEGFNVEKMIFCGRTDGVYDADGKTIKKITQKSFKRHEEVLSGSEGIDVTGGMRHKVEEALELAKKGIPTLIIDGVVRGTLKEAITDNKIVGTSIE